MFSKQTYIERRELLRNCVGSGVILICGNSEASVNCASSGYHFRQDSDFLYFFGLSRADLTAIIDIDNNREYIFGDDIPDVDTVWTGDLPTVADDAALVGVENCGNDEQLISFLKCALSSGRKIHFTPQHRRANVIKYGSILGLYPENFNQYVSPELIKAIVSQRLFKSAEEVEQINEACNIGYEMHTAAMRGCEIGKTERYIAGIIEGKSLEYGNGVSFHNIVTQRGHILHNHDHNGILTDGKLLLVDAGATTTMDYASDFSRTMPVNGKFTTVQRDIYQIIQNSFELGVESVKPGVSFKEVHLAASTVIAEGMKNLGFLKGNIQDMVQSGAHALFFPCGLGHHMGLDFHDMESLGEEYFGYDETVKRSEQFGLRSLRMARELKENHVMTIEPGIYFNPILTNKWKIEGINTEFINFGKVEEYLNFGGARIEDSVLVTADGYRVLGDRRIPYTADDIEAEMKKPLY